MNPTTPLMTEAVTELVAIGAAIASNCEPCFRYHYDMAHKLGVSKDDMRKAVKVALAVKATPHRKVMETVDRYLALANSNPSEASEGCSCGSSSQG